MALFRADHDSGFEDLFDRPDPLPLVSHIPKIAHYVHSRVQEQTWRDYAVIRSALDHIGVSKVNIWVTEDANGDLPGEMWERIQKMPNVTIREIPMPDTVWGKKVEHTEHTSDLVRMLAIYDEGGLYFDTDVMALKSADDIIYSTETKSAVMARQEIPSNAISNAMIMAKPGSPFLRRWMGTYKDFDPGEWDHTSCQLLDGATWDVQAEPGFYHSHTFMYPMRVNPAELGPDPELSRMWLGKSWHDIDASYGVHMWKWEDNHRHVVINPQTVRAIDTPIFCRMRKLFDNLDGDGYYSIPFRGNPNCTLTWTKDLHPNQHLLFSDYQMSSDTMDIKWVDSSGYNLHGHAPKGTRITHVHDTPDPGIIRNFTANSYAWLPVPSDWDARVGTARMVFQLHPKAGRPTAGQDLDHIRRKEIGLFKIRMDYSGEIVISLISEDDLTPVNSTYAVNVRFQWYTKFLSWHQFEAIDNAEWVSENRLLLTTTTPNELSLSFDRRDNGSITVYLDGSPISSGHLPLLASPKIADEIWMNSRQWMETDTGFRGELHRFTMYAGVVPAKVLAQPLYPTPCSTTASPLLLVLFLIPLILLLIAITLRARIAKGYKALTKRIPNGYNSLRDMNAAEKLHNYFPSRFRIMPSFRTVVVLVVVGMVLYFAWAELVEY